MSEMGLPISALATYESPGGQYALADPTIVQAPAFFVALENDIKPTVLLPAAIEHLATEVSASWPVDYHLGLEKSLNAERFLKIPGVTQTLAEALFDLLVGDGVIDATGLRLQNLNDLDGYEPNWSLLIGQPTDPGFSPMFFQDEVLRQLKIVWGQHVVSNEWRDEQVRWFLRYHPDAGDFDLDGDVDGFDFLKWQRDQSPNPLSASDLADWEANFGMAASLSANSVTVPEPSSAALLIVIAAVSILTRRPPGGSRSDSPFSA